jgi:hypothetical protein
MTIDSPKIILEILQNKGRYSDDPPADSAWKYFSTLKRGWAYAVYYNPYILESSYYVQHPQLLLSRGTLTQEGTTEVESILLSLRGEEKK